ncbi:alpha/beta hydrolase [Desulfonema magnum]|uniref:Alpha/beta hydrolase fold-containing n=1 Tax=Desulfonema magnum TaxID=45655 RepID=A0A975BWH4_9BACT|nr:alpha/beta hydrolase [Desulfonema magnum]QTA93080.1 alpha/beta hydrolase fold-containing [Desulfonema magnum]
MEEKIIFVSEAYEIEGLFEKNDGEKGVVITHPHPLYGGDMYNYVVEAILHAYKKSGYTTLRFNFRGAGRSQGMYDNGVGEQKDIRSAISYLLGQNIKQIDLAGYSFGAWVNAKVACNDDLVRNMVMVSPPAGFMDFQPVSAMPCLKLVVSGERDEIARADLIKDMVPIWNPKARLEIIKGAGHFYSGHLEKLQGILEGVVGQE